METRGSRPAQDGARFGSSGRGAGRGGGSSEAAGPPPASRTSSPRSDASQARPAAKATSGADELPTLITRNDLRVLRAGGWISVDEPQILRMLTTRRWTFDARRGQLVVER